MPGVVSPWASRHHRLAAVAGLDKARSNATYGLSISQLKETHLARVDHGLGSLADLEAALPGAEPDRAGADIIGD